MRPSLLNTYRIFLTFLLCVITCQVVSAGANPDPKNALKDYCTYCMSQPHSPDLLKMCDTLAMRAKEAGDGHFEVMAARIRLDYYYFRNDKDKVPEQVAEVMRMCRKYNERDSYYFTWGSRLISFYLRNGMPNHALLEAQNMLREAQAEDDPKCMIECYKAMGNIFTVQSDPEQAAEYYRKMIDLVEKYDSEDVNIPVYYSSLSESELSSGHLESAKQALDKVEEYFAKTDTITPYQRLSIDRGLLKIYLKQKDKANAQKVYERIEQGFAKNKGLAIHAPALNEARLGYYMSTSQYDKAISVIDSILQGKPSSEMLTFLLSRKADISWIKNDRAAAAEYYRDYIALTDSVRRISAQRSANEIAGLLNLQQLEKEKQQLEVDMQRRRLHTTYWALFLLGVALVAGVVVVIRQFRLNRQLKEAQAVVVLRNRELQEAKLKAEEASRMKSRFIQDISHEVRTPLNAIVGFSEVIGELSEQPEAKEYASIIASNSDNLLRLFNDVLELSSLDELKKLSYNTVANPNDNCEIALDQVKPLIKKDIELLFHSSNDNIQILTNPIYVTRVLNSMLHNAAKFTEKGRITLECAASPSEGVIRYSVTDTGPGIPLDKQDLIFERFKKVDSFTQGSGLGLAVCWAIAEKLGGTLELDKTYTHGCRFILTLPLLFPEK